MLSYYHPSVARLLLRPDITQRTPEWYAARQELITASDAAAALSIKPFASYKGNVREDTLCKKLNNHPFSNIYTRHGQRYEDEACEKFCEAVDEVAIMRGLVIHDTEKWLGASPDGLAAKSGGLIEIKCPVQRTIIPGHVPTHYFPQVQLQMEVCNFEFTYFVQYKPAEMMSDKKAVLDITIVERDRHWFATHKAALHSFWKEYQDRRKTHIPAPLPAQPQCLIVDSLYSV